MVVLARAICFGAYDSVKAMVENSNSATKSTSRCSYPGDRDLHVRFGPQKAHEEKLHSILLEKTA